MKKKIVLFSSIGGALLLAAIILIIVLCIPKGNAYRSIKLFDFENSVTINRDGSNLTATKNMKLKNDDEINVGSSSKAILKLDSDKFIMAKENTTLSLKATGKKNNTKTRILVSNGGVVVEVKNKLKDSESFEIASSNSVMAIRGTQIGFNVTNDTTSVTTSLSILKGETDIFLLKSDSLNKTSLIHDEALTYTTVLDNTKTLDEMSNLLDNSTINDIDDSKLKEEFDTEKRELTSAEIDSIVDAINEFERKENELENGTIKFINLPSSIEYGINPNKVINTDKDYSGIKYLYSDTIDGEYKLFDELDPITLGTWYLKALSSDAYRSDPFQITIDKRNITFNYDTKQTTFSGYATNTFELINNTEILDYEFAKELNDNAAANGYKYKYYIELLVNDGTETTSVILDHDSKLKMMDKLYNSGTNFTITANYNLPDYFVINETNFNASFESKADLDSVVIKCDARYGTREIFVFFDEYFASNESDKFKVMLKDNFNPDQEIEVSEYYGYGYYSFTLENDSAVIAIESFEYDGTDKTKGYREFEIDCSQSSNDDVANITSGDNILTYNEDGTINAYIDCKYNPSFDTYYSFAHIHSNSFNNGVIGKLAIGQTKRFIAIEDMIYASYNVDTANIVALYNDVYYTVKSTDVEYMSEIRPGVSGDIAFKGHDYDSNTTTISGSNSNFDTSKDIIIHANGADYKVGSEYLLDNLFSNFVIDGTDLNVTIDATLFTTFDIAANDDIFEFDNYLNVIDNNVFAIVKDKVKTKLGLTIKGSNTFTVTDVEVQEI